MNPQLSRNVLLIRAVEETDADGVVISSAEREQATAQANPSAMADDTAGSRRGPTGAERDFIVRRARILQKQLSKRHPEVATALSAVRWRRSVAVFVVLVAFVVGVLSNQLGGEHVINILTFPVIGMVAWNLLVYLLLIARGLVPRATHAPGRNALSALVQRITAPMRPVTIEHGNDSHAVLTRGLTRFASDWFTASSRYHWSCTRQVLHTAAAMLAAGAIAGLYARGLFLEYRAGWESLWLDAQSVEALFHALFTPASVLTGIPLPDATEIAALRFSDDFKGENAARWIHLYGMTAAIFIIVPRLALATLCNLHACRRLRRVLEWEWKDPYFRRLVQVGKGEGEKVDVVSYSFDPGDSQRESLRVLLHELWGGRANLDFLPTVNYGDEEEFVADWQKRDPADHTVVFMNIASTPEDENHGVLLAGLQKHMQEPDGQAGAGVGVGDILIALDASAFSRFLGTDTYARRIEERSEAWKQMLDRYGLRFVVTHRPNTILLADEVSRLVWTP